MIADTITPQRQQDMLFVGAGESSSRRKYGGELFAQAVMAATQTVAPERLLHGAHSYFARAADAELPVEYEVVADFDGGSLSNRRVIARQSDKRVLTLTASFEQDREEIPTFVKIDDVPDFSESVSLRDYLEKYGERHIPDPTHIVRRLQGFDVRVVNGPLTFGENVKGDSVRLWFRHNEDAEDSEQSRRGLLAYFSDFTILSAALHRAGAIWSTNVQMMTINHALWIHDRVDVRDWGLFAFEACWQGVSRSFCRGQFFSRDGRLIASCAQEGVVRIRS